MSSYGSSARYRLVENAFQRAVDLPEDRRAEFLAKECGTDGALRLEVEALLRSYAAAGEIFDQPLYVGAAQRCASDPIRIGRYRVQRKLGEGGMAVVFEATQTLLPGRSAGSAPVPQRSVAVKVIRPGVFSPKSRSRFEFEAAVLARLQHPGIAHIYEAGLAEVVYPTGGAVQQPFFAMELVQGETLLQHMRRKELSTRPRLDLFIKICDAVEHAHQKGVIHRDLKPSNIIVTPAGEPKVLDFGVARVTESDVQLTTAHSEAALVGTLPYMSPEQVSARLDQLDTRSDVYALGVVFYELLAGRLPYDLAGKPIAAAAQVITDVAPTALSAVDRGYRGDLETIVGKALEKDPARRYASVDALADDVRRFLRHEPIAARRDSALYVLRKRLRRHRVAAVVGAAFVLVLGGATAALSVLYRQQGQLLVQVQEQRDFAEDARQREALAREDATRAAERASQSLALVERILTAPAPNEETGGFEVSFRQHLDGFSDSLGVFDDPQVEITVRTALGRAYASMGDLVAAAPHLTRAVELTRGRSEPAELLSALHGLAVHYLQTGWPRRAETLLHEAAATWGRIAGTQARGCAPGSPARDTAATGERAATCERDPGAKLETLAHVKQNLGWSLLAQEHFREAREAYLEAIRLYDEGLGPHSSRAAFCEKRVVIASIRLGEAEAAERVARDSLERARADLGPLHEAVRDRLLRLANFYQYVGRHADAEPLLREQLEVSREISASTETIAACIASIGVNLLDQGRTAEAEEPLRTALALLEGDEEFSGVARQTRDKLAELLQASDRHSECETLWRETLERARRRFGAGHSLAGLTLRRMGELLLTQEDRLPEALAAAEESWRILGMRLGSFHDEAHRVLCLLADACDRQGEYAEAADALEHVLETYRERAPLVGYQRSQQTDLVNRIVSIYEGWDAAEPGQGHAAEAEEWRAELRGWADVSGPRP